MFTPDKTQLGILAAVLRQLYSDDVEGLEIIDTSDIAKRQRGLRIYRYADLVTPSSDELNSFFQTVADAYDVLLQSGFNKPARKQPPKDLGPDLFTQL